MSKSTTKKQIKHLQKPTLLERIETLKEVDVVERYGLFDLQKPTLLERIETTLGLNKIKSHPLRMTFTKTDLVRKD